MINNTDGSPTFRDRSEPTVEGMWTAAYPTMRMTLDQVIRANRGVARPVVDVERLEQARRALGQLDRGTYKPCTRSPGVTPAESPSSALTAVRAVLGVTSVGDPALGMFYRLASVLAVASYERVAARLEQNGGAQ